MQQCDTGDLTEIPPKAAIQVVVDESKLVSVKEVEFSETNSTSIVENFEELKGGSDLGGEFVPIVAIEGENEPNNVEKAEIRVKDEDDVKKGDKVDAKEVEMVDEKALVVNIVELAEEKVVIDEKEKELVVEEVEEAEEKAVIDEKDKEVVVEEEEEEGEEMDCLSDVAKNDDELETVKSGSGGGKRKRGPKAKVATPVKSTTRKGVVEDVCFLCLDGGELVLCDRRGCSKAYHPSCVGHDAEFFKTKGRWNCGWHQCNQCGKNVVFMCYTCQFSLCKSCSKDAAISFVRGNKGFCETCLKTIMVIESSETGHNAFSDKSSWEYKFKDYWLQQKEKLDITSNELSNAKKPWKDSYNQQTSIEAHEGDNDGGDDSDSLPGNKELSESKRKKAKRKAKSVDYDTDSSSEKDANTGKKKSRRLKSQAKENSDSEHSSPDISNTKGKKARRLSKSCSKSVKWASKELLEFVVHMKNGDQSVLTQFDVQELLLAYIKRNKLRDPRRQSQIICDSMLKKIFGKPRVAHFEMLKLLESHFLLKDDSHTGDNQGIVADTEMSQLTADDNTDSLLDGGKSRGKKLRKRGEERGSQSNLDDYAAIDMHNINLIFLRRNLLEALMENSETFHEKAVSSFVRIRTSGGSQKQDIYRLVQITGTSKAAESYKVGKRTTDVMLEILNLDKTETTSIDIISNQDFSEDECKRLRQSIKCGLINRMTVGDVLEKATVLHEVRIADWLESEIMRLSHLRDRASEKGRKKELRECVEKLQLLKTPEERQRRLDEIPEVHADPKMDPSCESEDEMEMTQGDIMSKDTGFVRRGRDQFSSRKEGSVSSDSWRANARPPNQKLEPNRNSSGMDFSGRREEMVFTSPTREHSNGVDKGLPRSNSREKPRMTSGSSILAAHFGVRDIYTLAVSESPRISTVAGQTDSKVSETEKLWHYRDPAGKIQGPFSMTQLRKWNSTGYFPTDLRIWRISQSDSDSILLTDVLAGRFDKEVPSVGPTLIVGSAIRNAPSSIDVSKLSGNSHSSGTGGRYDSYNLPSPTPTRSSFPSSNQTLGDIERLPSPTPMSPSDPTGVGRLNRGENFASSIVQAAAQNSFSTSGAANGLQIAPQSMVHMQNQPFTVPNSMTNQPNLAQLFSNVIQPGTVQNPSVYTRGWSSGHAARPEPLNASMTHKSPNAALSHVAYGASYTRPGNIVTNLAGMPAEDARRSTSTNMPWDGQQHQMVNRNMPSGTTTMGWSGAGTSPSAGRTNPGWVAAPRDTGGRGGDQNRHRGGAQWNRQTSFGNR